jgi:hypothetical protein
VNEGMHTASTAYPGSAGHGPGDPQRLEILIGDDGGWTTVNYESPRLMATPNQVAAVPGE